MRQLDDAWAARVGTPAGIISTMASITAPALSSLVRAQLSSPSPIRQIMKMAERQNIIAMGLDPDQVISFGGGWVNHEAPEEFRQAYVEVAGDPALFHKSGGYTATLGELECREQIAQFEAVLFDMPRLGPEHVAIGMGSTQLTHDLFRTLVNPGDTVLLLDPTYANYEGQLAFAAPGVSIVRLRVVDPDTWTYLPVSDPDGSRASSRASSTCTSRGWCCLAPLTTPPARSCRRDWPS